MQAFTVTFALVQGIQFTLWIGDLISRSIELIFSYTLRCMAGQYLNEVVLRRIAQFRVLSSVDIGGMVLNASRNYAGVTVSCKLSQAAEPWFGVSRP